MFVLSDIFIGNFPTTQAFGADPERYNARYGIKSHNGVDWACPTGTMILSAADGVVSEIGIENPDGSQGTFDSAGYGRYVKVVHNGYLTLYAHLNDITVHKGDHVVAGQLIAHSNNTGNSTGPHLHFGVAPCDANGSKTEMSNGWSGYIDPMDTTRVKWELKNPSSPVLPGGNDQEATIPVKTSDFTTLVSQSTNYKNIASYLIDKGLNGYLAANNRTIIDFNANPNDPVGGESCVLYLSEILAAAAKLQDENEKLRTAPPPLSPVVSDNIAQQIETLPTESKTRLLTALFNSVKGFIFVGGSK